MKLIKQLNENNQFYLVGPATPDSELVDVLTKLTVQDLFKISRGILHSKNVNDNDYELFPADQKDKAEKLAHDRLKDAGR